MDGRMIRWRGMNEWRNGWMEEWLEGGMIGWKGMNGWRNDWMERNEWMVE